MEKVVSRTVQSGSVGRAAPELTALLKAGRYAELADQCREIMGPARFAGLLRTELAQRASPPKATHRAIVQTPYASLVTTNFDTLLEDAYGLWSDVGVPKCPTGAQLDRHGTLLLDRTFFILKAHGTIHDAESLVFTSGDYRRIIHANPAFQAMLAAILLSHAVIFVGYSLNDPNFRLLLDSQLSVFGGQAPPRYALMEGIGPLEAKILRRTAGIEAIPYPKGRHECVAEFLDTLASATRAAPSGGKTRSKVFRKRRPLPTLVVAIRPREAMLDFEWFETRSDDLQGVGVPLERRAMGSAPFSPFTELFRKNKGNAYLSVREIGPRLADLAGRMGLPLIAAGKPRLVMLDLPHELAGIPWEWMYVGGKPLCLQTPLCRTIPGLDDASRGRPFFRSPLRVLVIGDALAESRLHRHPLPGTRLEAEEIAGLFGAGTGRHSVTSLVGPEASYERVLEELAGGYDIVHLTGAAYQDESGESRIPLHDGEVSATELATLLIRNPPGLLFVNEDLSGFVPVPVPWLESAWGSSFGDFYHRLRQMGPGLERVVARAGVGTFIGCMEASTENVARRIAVDFYRHLLAGRPVAEALFLARTAEASIDDLTPLYFAMAGYPDSRITDAANRPASYTKA